MPSKSIGRLVIASFLLVLAGFGLAQSDWARYRVWTRTAAEVQRLANSPLQLFSEEPAMGATDVVVGPNEFLRLLAIGLPYQKISTLPPADAWKNASTQDGSDYRATYFDMNALLDFFERLRVQYPRLISRQQIGVSHNLEKIWAYRIFREVTSEHVRPPKNIVLVGGAHAREWISPSVTMHIAANLAAELSTAETTLTDRLTDNVGVWIIPEINPDGYRYSWSNNRYWRKNRRDNGSGIFGVDLNRNYPVGWGGQGSSSNINSDVYHGPAPFSEPETSGLKALAKSLPNLLGFIDWHSFGQQVLWPWSYTTSPAPQASLFNSIGLSIRNNMLAHGGATYVQGQASITLYIAGGTSKDWFYDQFRTAAFTIELRDTGQSGFLLPESQIRATQDEAWWAFVALTERVIPAP